MDWKIFACAVANLGGRCARLEVEEAADLRGIVLAPDDGVEECGWKER